MAFVTFRTTDLANYSEAVILLGISRQTLYTWIEKEMLHPLAIGRNRFLLRAEIEKLKAERITDAAK